jgi:hypothetical protein
MIGSPFGVSISYAHDPKSKRQTIQKDGAQNLRPKRYICSIWWPGCRS